MSAAALIPTTNAAASRIPSFPTAQTRRKSPVSVMNSLLTEAAGDQAATEAESAPRRLILLRHAKSSWKNRSLKDHDRPLSKSGRADAVKLSKKLDKLGWVPQLILSSDALRTRETLQIMQEQIRAFLEAEVQFISSFYSVAAMDGQTAEHLQQVICRYTSDRIFTIMCMGHNRGWEEAASMLSGTPVELKTCNAALLEATGKSWEEAFSLAGFGGWKLHGIVKPDTQVEGSF
ncbi:Phosphoglycerate mutase family protein [Striga hermonthica]|uniref:Phosphoglycerate mutase family protein n=1 Tax=Striga hermonthica TaxID=68872 RepID=A0A9N7NSX7_STRHE|nr:Phosphoglycerate mutase family protein [Striga hermonthica]